MATYQFLTQGTCARAIQFTIENGALKDVAFEGGCNGNLQGISRLVDGRSAEEVAGLVAGTQCGFKPTSCPDQLSRAIRGALEMEAGKPSPLKTLVRVR